ncbi:hypothetical protein HRG_004949 [Hirsutella rhossiliensis]|uniref:Uncharacterized protein n=1 Tax=Hirsutella rhossiliensis TaxID=111463 RepID=A0A9P8SKW4_9HYPO|nr:uncharacterized protein HRG_04949 [Hirsutella rhossiliensis]KAH0964521.1 hypothetical protein HRG_04949 [Hirsutella rhossiliensis]
MARRKRQQIPQGFEFDFDLQQGQVSQKRRRRQTNDVPDPAMFLEDPFFGGHIGQPGPATINGGGIHYRFVHDENSLGPPFPVQKRTEPPILVASHSLLELGLDIPPQLGNEEVVRRKGAIWDELKYQSDNIPSLPPSKVPDLPPKEELPAFVEIPAGLDADSRAVLEEENNRIAKLAQDIDRERNNMAAKKSRSLRVEGIAGYRELCVQATAKLFFHRLVDVASGRDPDSWERLPENIRGDMLGVIRMAVRKAEDDRTAKKKAAEAQARFQRAQEKKAQLEAAAALAGPVSFEQTGTLVSQDEFDDTFQVETPDHGV